MFKLFVLFSLIGNFAYAKFDVVTFTACDLTTDHKATVTVVENSVIDLKLVGTGDKFQPTDVKAMMVLEKLRVEKNEISAPMEDHYTSMGVKNIDYEMEYAAEGEVNGQSVEFMVNVIYQNDGARGLNIGIPVDGNGQSFAEAFVGSTSNCK